MFTVVTGGSASGKSEFAEGLVLNCGDLPRFYIATMQPFDDECFARIEKHRKMRAEKGFETIECQTDLKSIDAREGEVYLLECMSNLSANELFKDSGSYEKALNDIFSGVEILANKSKDLIIVTNDVFSNGVKYDESTEKYLKLLSEINISIAKMADNVIEVVCGIPIYHKKSLKISDRKAM